MNEPTEKQMNAIRKLARATKSNVNLDSIGSKKEASKLIDKLIAKRNGTNGNGGGDCRERKVAYGLAVKLVFVRYQQLSTNYRTEEFWREVDEFYGKYMEHQDRAMKLGSQR